jgi:hypothetical protein
MTCETQHAGRAGGGRDGRAGGAVLAAGDRRRAISPRRLYANRRNARASTGPRTAAGKARAAQNARRHGLSGAACDPARDHDVEVLARKIAGDGADDGRIVLARRIAEAQLDLMRARRARGAPTVDTLSTSGAIRRRAAIDRYERRAWSRRRRAIEHFDDAGAGVVRATPTVASTAPSQPCADLARAIETAAARAPAAFGQNEANQGFASAANALQGIRGAGRRSHCSCHERRWGRRYDIRGIAAHAPGSRRPGAGPITFPCPERLPGRHRPPPKIHRTASSIAMLAVETDGVLRRFSSFTLRSSKRNNG